MTKLLRQGNSKVQFYPTIENPVTVVELNSTITSLVSSSSSTDIESAFEGMENFNTLLTVLRQSTTVVNGITIATETEAGNITADIQVSKTTDELTVRWISNQYQYTLVVTKADNQLSCTKTQLLLGSEVDLSNYLSKTNNTSYTPTNNYNPATKKYVDDNVVYNLNIVSTDGSSASVSETYYNTVLNCITINQNIVVVLVSGGSTYRMVCTNIINSEGTITLKCNRIDDSDNLILYTITITGTSFTNNCTIATKTYPLSLVKTVVITESDYSDLGEAVNTDNILYNVIPD